MGFCEVLTVIFVACKLMGIIGWSWVQVFIPMYFAVSIYLGMFLLFILAAIAASKNQRSNMKKPEEFVELEEVYDEEEFLTETKYLTERRRNESE